MSRFSSRLFFGFVLIGSCLAALPVAASSLDGLWGPCDVVCDASNDYCLAAPGGLYEIYVPDPSGRAGRVVSMETEPHWNDTGTDMVFFSQDYALADRDGATRITYSGPGLPTLAARIARRADTVFFTWDECKGNCEDRMCRLSGETALVSGLLRHADRTLFEGGAVKGVAVDVTTDFPPGPQRYAIRFEGLFSLLIGGSLETVSRQESVYAAHAEVLPGAILSIPVRTTGDRDAILASFGFEPGETPADFTSE